MQSEIPDEKTVSAPVEMDAIPAFINMEAGNGQAAYDLIASDSRFVAHRLEPDSCAEALTGAVKAGARRILVSGGDGTIAAAASAVAGTETELAIIPGGTLNHFAKDHAIPLVLEEAIEQAVKTETRKADVAYVNDKIFLNTCSVGAYVMYVHARETRERWFGYYGASLIAALRMISRLPRYTVQMQIESQILSYETPLVFVGVGEREVKMPHLGSRVEGGKRGLHAIIVKGKTRARVMALVLAAAAKGIHGIKRTPHAESLIVDRFAVDLPHDDTYVAVDGEIMRLPNPLQFRIDRDALTIVAPVSE